MTNNSIRQLSLSFIQLLKAIALFLLLICSLGFSKRAVSQTPVDNSHGEFSIDAFSLGGSRTPRQFTIISPDHRKKIIVYDSGEGQIPNFEAFMMSRAKQNQLFGGHVDPEVMWSPDSKAFAETYSDAGAVGLFHVLIYYDGGSRVIEPTAQVTKEFLSHPRTCFEPEDPNVGAIEWMKDSSEILVAAETLPHSNCDDMGTFRAYIIHLPDGDILKSYGQIEAKKLFWKHMGSELRNADDECILKPGSCYIPQLHPDKHSR